MKKLIVSTLVVGALFSCNQNAEDLKNEKDDDAETTTQETGDNFEYIADQFADLQILRYKADDFNKLSLDQKKLVYYLTQAGLSGRDIVYDQNYKHNLEIRNALENIVKTFEGDKDEDWENFMIYVKELWFANGIHHHYSTDKFEPQFGRDYLEALLSATKTELSEEAIEAIFNPDIDNKRVNLDKNTDIIKESANNFYGEGVTAKMVDEFYEKMKNPNDSTPISYGLNSQLVLNEEGELEERVWKVDGMYGPAIEEIVFWLEKAVEVAENEPQRKALELLIKYYHTGDLKDWDEYSIAWTKATDGDIDYINGFIEVYGDSKGYRANYESVVQMTDFEASKRMKIVADHAQYFEDHSPIMDEHKRKEVKGVSYKVVEVVGESGDASPATPIGINLPNAEWIREAHGSKSVSLGNIIDAYGNASAGSLTEEFAFNEEEAERAKKYGTISDNLHTALHEVIGHASGKMNKGVGTPKETLKSYASALEEARADLVGLYYLMDEKLVEWDLMESLDAGKAAYDGYIRNGLMTQLRRIKIGKDLEEAHMRNRQLVALWAYEKGKEDNVIERVEKDGKTYFVINDYDALRTIFGQLLREIQRVKSEGDYEAGKALIENYGVVVDREIHKEVLERSEPLNIPPYSGFINPEYEVVKNEDGEITDIKIVYPTDFKQQMLDYSEKYSFLKP